MTDKIIHLHDKKTEAGITELLRQAKKADRVHLKFWIVFVTSQLNLMRSALKTLLISIKAVIH